MSDGKYELIDTEAVIYGSDSARGVAECPITIYYG